MSWPSNGDFRATRHYINRAAGKNPGGGYFRSSVGRHHLLTTRNQNLFRNQAQRATSRARVDIWHADAQGIYSGYPGQGDNQDLTTVGQKFLRGTQFTDSRGAASFKTIYPGWYPGRATHIHFKVLVDDRNVLTGQMYFPDAINEFIYANIPAYAGRRNLRAVVNANDRFANFNDPNRLSFCAVKEERDCYAVSLVLGVDRFALARAGLPPRAGQAPEQPAVERVRLLIPGLGVK